MEGYYKFKVDIIKFDGTNKEEIIDRLNIKLYVDLYFKKIGVFFIIPKHNKDNWFILEERFFKNKIELLNKND